ncbi:hypothetical protein AB9F41_19705 [Rhizobium leguminosarum]|uniref:hypothetical protein n=1 Tax=Rhizobium leguminosarum TaxID=384 RepID=UPI003F9C9982
MNDMLFQNSEIRTAEGLGLWPILIRPDEVINIKTAVFRAGRDEKTIRGWCKEFGIGRQAKPGAPLDISAPALEMVMHGDLVALELLRDGKRTDPRVSRYFDFLGLPSY